MPGVLLAGAEQECTGQPEYSTREDKRRRTFSNLGEDLYIELCDEQVDGWAHAFFDEVVTYYEQAPDYSNNADTVPDGGTGEEVTIPWQLLE